MPLLKKTPTKAIPKLCLNDTVPATPLTLESVHAIAQATNARCQVLERRIAALTQDLDDLMADEEDSEGDTEELTDGEDA